jgi:hypothetical protein
MSSGLVRGYTRVISVSQGVRNATRADKSHGSSLNP